MAAARSARGKRRFDDDGWEPSPSRLSRDPDHDPDRNTRHDTDHDSDHDGPQALEDADDDEPRWSTYRDATKGPEPVPSWVVVDPRAIDTDHGVLKTGKEADVSLLHRRVDPDHAAGGRAAGGRAAGGPAAGGPAAGGPAPGGPAVGAHARDGWLAVKQYRSAEHRMFHRDSGYLEGRRVRRSREMRAMATRTEFGRELIAGQWAAAEFAVLSRIWTAGAAVPYPVQLIGTELMMEFIGADGVAAPRLAQVRPSRHEASSLYEQMREVLRQLADVGYAHGDLSPYNVLVHEGRIVLIDLPQAVDLVGNPQGFDYLRRDCANICSWFAAHGAAYADADELHAHLLRSVPGLA